MLKKIILGVLAAAFLFLIGFILFFPLDSFVKKKIDGTLGPGISFTTLKIRWGAIVADDVAVKTSSGTDFLTIKHLRLSPSILELLRKRLEIKRIELDSPSLVIKKAKNNRWLLPEFKKKKAEGTPMEFIIKAFDVSNGNILFIDETKDFRLDLSDVSIDMRSRFFPFSSDKISINASAKLPSEGKVSINSDGNVITKNFTGKLSIKDLNITLLKPYISGDVRIKKGRLNLDSNINLDKGYVKAPSHLNVRDLDIETRGIIMGVSAPLVIELAKKKGTLDLDFNVWGRWNNLQNDLKESFQKKVFAELGKTVTSPIEDAAKGIKNLLPF